MALALLLLALSLASGTSALKEPIQDGEFCNRLKVTGTGSFEVGVSVVDKTHALEYFNFMYGDGDLEMDSTSATAERSGRLPGYVSGSKVPLNLYEDTSMAYSGTTPLVGIKYIHSKEFYGGIGAEILETFEVTEMDRRSTTFFASTNPASYLTDPAKIAQILRVSPVHTVGIETTNAFNGTWETDAKMHKFFSKDVKAHERFSGKFEVDKMLKFHENPVPENKKIGCQDIDC
ncbi:MAG: hypothetical protein MUO26_00680 [Methanotrichaceae archaeon]|nr:hypothetical protein [Methanotrichaceae archaeon]